MRERGTGGERGGRLEGWEGDPAVAARDVCFTCVVIKVRRGRMTGFSVSRDFHVLLFRFCPTIYVYGCKKHNFFAWPKSVCFSLS